MMKKLSMFVFLTVCSIQIKADIFGDIKRTGERAIGRTTPSVFYKVNNQKLILQEAEKLIRQGARTKRSMQSALETMMDLQEQMRNTPLQRAVEYQRLSGKISEYRQKLSK